MSETHTDMHALMVHVERIVRPVRARQARKLRMRRELLTHLLAALEEERASAPDEATAIERAKQRLGDPAELTRQLQKSAPLIERVLLARTSEKINGWERRLARIFGDDRPATILHWAILYGCGAAAMAIVCLCSPRVSPADWNGFSASAAVHGTHFTAVILSTVLLQYLWLFAGMRFLGSAVRPQATFSVRRLIVDASLMLAVQLALLLLIMTQIFGRTPQFSDLATSLGASALLIAPAAWVGRWVARLRAPYDEWLMLDIAS